MTTPESSVPWYGTPKDWSQIISGAGQGAGAAMQGSAINASSKEEAKEAKRRTLAKLMNQALGRNQGLFRIGQEHEDEMNDVKNQMMQQVAQGFVNSLRGSTQ